MQFTELPLTDSLLEGLDAMNFKNTTPVQEQAIPILLKKKDVIACAQTGTGKTAAFLLPLLNNLQTDNHDENKVNAIIMAPTRELAQQIDQMMEGFSYYTPFSSVAVYGGNDGDAWDIQKRGLQNGADVVIATPGRLLSHINLYNIDFSGIKYFILDEADRMLDMGFYEDIMKIVKLLPKDRQTVMFSATMPPKIQQMAKNILSDPEEISIAVAKPPESIIQSAYICYEAQKMEILKLLFKNKKPHKVILFSGKKQKVKEITKTIHKMNLSVGEMHSDLDQAQREHVMHEFRNERVDILVATDIVSRGIDIDDITLVINFDVPYDVEDYVHRIGRTARAGDSGMAITFVTPEEQYLFEQIENFLQKTIYRIPVPSELGETPEYNPDNFRRQKGGKRHSSRRTKSEKPNKAERTEKTKRTGKKNINGSADSTDKGKSRRKGNQNRKKIEITDDTVFNRNKRQEQFDKNQNTAQPEVDKPLSRTDSKPGSRKGKKLVKKKRDYTKPEMELTEHSSKEGINSANETTPSKPKHERVSGMDKGANKKDQTISKKDQAVSRKKHPVNRKDHALNNKSQVLKRKEETARQTDETAKKKKKWSWWPFGKK